MGVERYLAEGSRLRFEDLRVGGCECGDSNDDCKRWGGGNAARIEGIVREYDANDNDLIEYEEFRSVLRECFRCVTLDRVATLCLTAMRWLRIVALERAVDGDDGVSSWLPAPPDTSTAH